MVGERWRKGEVGLGPGSQPVDRVPAGARCALRDKGYQGVVETICCEELGGTLGARFTEDTGDTEVCNRGVICDVSKTATGTGSYHEEVAEDEGGAALDPFRLLT